MLEMCAGCAPLYDRGAHRSRCAQGLWPNYIKVVPSIAIAFVTYEKLKEGLGVELRISS